MYERPSKMDVFRKKTNKETERKIAPEKNSGSVEPCDQEAVERCLLKRFYPQCMGAKRKLVGKVRTQGKKAKTVHR